MTRKIDPRKRPLQSRSRDTFEIILQASSELLSRDGLVEFNTNQIAERAGISIGSLYQYFPNKEAILATIIRQMRKEMRDDFKQAIESSSDDDLPSAIKALIAASLHHHLDDPSLTEILEKAEDDLPLDSETQALKQEMALLVVGLLKSHGVEAPEQTAFDLIALSHGMTHAATQAGQNDFDNLSQRLERAVFGYLGLSYSG